MTGEPGIGKTARAETFLQQAVAQSNVRVARGQCHEHYGAGEAYMPVFDALTQFCRDQQDETLLALLAQQAPTWLIQMPSLASAADLESLQGRIQGATRERMLREMEEALEALTREQALILVLEDLHWSNYSTLDLITMLAQRKSSAKLFLLATYRPTDVYTKRHPLYTIKHELQMHRQCEELELGFLQESAVTEYLEARFPPNGFPPSFAQTIHRRTEGNPLFMVNMLEYLTTHGLIVHQHDEWNVSVNREAVECDAPVSVRQIIEQQIELLDSHDRRLLEVASVVGVDFTAVAVAGGFSEEEEVAEERCAALARMSLFVRIHDIIRNGPTGVSPDDTVSFTRCIRRCCTTGLPQAVACGYTKRLGTEKKQDMENSAEKSPVNSRSTSNEAAIMNARFTISTLQKKMHSVVALIKKPLHTVQRRWSCSNAAPHHLSNSSKS